MKRTHVCRAGLAVALFFVGGLALAPKVNAQAVTTSAVTGRITEEGGKPLGSAQVTVTNAQTGTTSGGISDVNGRYYVPFLRPGVYNVSASSIGHRTVSRQGLQVTLGQDLTVDFMLPTEAVQLRGIEVTTEANPTFSPTKTGAQTVVTSSELESLPTITRNFAELSAVSPLVSTTGSAPSVAGENNRYNNIQIDGAVNNDVFGLADSGLPGGQANGKAISMDAIKEFQVLVAPFDVRQAGFTGGLINAVTKSGTNEFQGSAYIYFRNQSFIGNVNLGPSDVLTASQFKSMQYGFTLGGPIVRDKLHFFVAAELEKHDAPTLDNVGSSPPASIGIATDSMNSFVNILKGYGVDPGSPLRFTTGNPLNNLFARVDWQLNQRNRLTIRDSYNTAQDQSDPSRGGFYYDLSSYTYNFKNSTNTAVAQLYSTLGQDFYNELLFNYERIRDRRNPLVNYGTVQVDVTNDVGGSPISRRYEAGAEYYSHDNQLDQDILQLTDNLTRTYGAHRVTLGTSNEYFHFRNVFVPGSMGRWHFSSLAAFAANDPSTYDITVPYPGVTDPAARFGVFQLGGYLQDVWTVNDNLTLTAGLRLDDPIFPDSPRENPTFAQATGLHTSSVPSGNILWSPRLGFNWRSDISSTYRTQVRGGIGIFSGRPPYVWMSNAYGNTGHDTYNNYCRPGTAPPFTPQSPPTNCLGQTGGSIASGRLINIFAKNFRFPQDLKVSLAVDRDLPGGFVGTLEGLYTKAVNAIFLRDMNIPSTTNSNPGSRLGIGNRPIYGTVTSSGFAANHRYSAFDQIVEGVNTTAPYSYAIVAELKKSFGTLFDVQASYTYKRAFDTQSLTSSIATSNYGFNPIRGDPNNPENAPSNFDQPHKVLLVGTVHLLPQYGGTDISGIYIGQSGLRYSYVYYGDVNGDGYPGSGVASGRTNDLVYVPKNQSDIAMASPGDWTLLNEAIQLDPCLSKARGTILQRNACEAPWNNRLNLSIQQGLPKMGYGNVKLQANILNVLNLLNNKWGRDQGSIYNTDELLSLKGRNANGDLVFSYAGRTKEVNGQTHADLPYTTFFPSSAWQIQIGLRYQF